MTNLNPNSSNNPLAQNASFVGEWQLTDGKVAISVNLNCNSLALVTIQQSLYKNGAFIDNTQTSSYPVPSVAETYQVPVALNYFRVILQNVDIIDQTFCRLSSVLTNTITHGVDIRKLSAFADSDNVEIIAKDGTGTLRHVLCDANGALVTTPSAVAQDVNILSSVNLNTTETNSADIKTSVQSVDDKMIRQTATRPVYLMTVGTYYRVATVGNTTGAVWNIIGAIVGGESIPEIGRLFKCLFAPSNIEGQGTVYDVEYTDTPVVSGTVRIQDTYGGTIVTTAGNLMVGINNIYTANPLHTIVDSGSVAISSALPAGSNTIGNVYSYESPAQVANLTGVSTGGQTIKNSAGSLMNVTLFNDGNAISYVKLYNVAVPTSTDIPVMTFPVLHDSPIYTINTHNFQFTTAIGIRATANYGAADNTAPNGTTSAVCFFNGVAP
jgi:hypothetical protein